MTSSWFFLSTLNYDARSTTHQIGISSVTDCPRPDQAHPVVTPEGIAAVEDIVKENRRVTVNEIAAHLDMSHGSANHIVRDKKLKKNPRFSFDSPSVLYSAMLYAYTTFRINVGAVFAKGIFHPHFTEINIIQ